MFIVGVFSNFLLLLYEAGKDPLSRIIWSALAIFITTIGIFCFLMVDRNLREAILRIFGFD